MQSPTPIHCRTMKLTDARKIVAMLTSGTAIYFVANFYLWSLHQSQLELFVEAVPLGAIFCVGFFWYLIRTTK
jgi:hypothetical protein